MGSTQVISMDIMVIISFYSKCYEFPISGTLIDLFESSHEYFQAIEVTAGNRLFYHVVDNDTYGEIAFYEICFLLE